MKRIMALDVGDRRIGIAVTDPLGLTAQGLETWTRHGPERDAAHIAELIQEYDVGQLVVGQPRNMNGSAGPQQQKVEQFVDMLRPGICIPIAYQDERLTTLAAHRVLSMGDANHRQRKAAVDQMAASLILQSYMQGKGRTQDERDGTGNGAAD